MIRLPNGISNYVELVEEGYYYVDKTMYIEKLENLTDKRIMFLRPRKFGKTLFTSVLENYYDILKKDKFEKLFGNTYIGKNPTQSKNSYHILKFNFSGIDTENEESTIRGFKSKTIASIKEFASKYGLDFYVNNEEEAESILNDLFKAFGVQKANEKIYVIIDEYDHFANELLTFNRTKFKELVSRNGKIRKWYEVLKEATETVVGRIFITGVAPITLDSLTSGFNISKDITQDARFNNMMGFTKEELVQILNAQEMTEEEQSKLLPIMKENYDGYKFALDGKEYIYNSNMCLYLLSDYIGLGKIPNRLVDVNIASDYSKLSKMLGLCSGKNKIRIIEQTISGEGIVSEITAKFNPEVEFGDEELVSMLFYIGYLTIAGENLGLPELKIPNKVMRELYAEYFLNSVEKEINLRTSSFDYSQMAEELAYEGKIDSIIERLGIYLNNLSNRDYEKFDEKYVKILFYSIVMNLNSAYNIKSEFEVNREYPDLLLIPRERTKGYEAVMIEFKYLKKGEGDKLQEKQKEAREQIEKYSQYEEMQDIEKLNKYTIVAVVDKIYVEKIK